MIVNSVSETVTTHSVAIYGEGDSSCSGSTVKSFNSLGNGFCTPELVSNNQFEYWTATCGAASGSSSSDSTLIIILCVVGGVILIAAVGAGVYFFMSQKEQPGSSGGVAVQEIRLSDRPPPGGKYMKNGMWYDENGKPVPDQQI